MLDTKPVIIPLLAAAFCWVGTRSSESGPGWVATVGGPPARRQAARGEPARRAGRWAPLALRWRVRATRAPHRARPRAGRRGSSPFPANRCPPCPRSRCARTRSSGAMAPPPSVASASRAFGGRKASSSQRGDTVDLRDVAYLVFAARSSAERRTAAVRRPGTSPTSRTPAPGPPGSRSRSEVATADAVRG